MDLQRIGVDVGEIGLHATTIELDEGEGPADDGDDEDHDASLFDDMFGDIEGNDEGDGEDSDDEGDGEADVEHGELLQARHSRFLLRGCFPI